MDLVFSFSMCYLYYMLFHEILMRKNLASQIYLEDALANSSLFRFIYTDVQSIY